MNILMTIASLDSGTGGPARSVPFLSKKLYELGINVQIFVSKLPVVDKEVRERIGECPVKKISSLLPTLRDLERKKSGSTIIHNHGIWLPINHKAAVLAGLTGVPLLVSPRGMLEPWAYQYHRYKKMLAWFVYQRRDLSKTTVFHATASQESYNIQSLGFGKPVAIIPNGVEVPSNHLKMLSPGKTKTALFLSRIHPKKGLKNLVHAWHEVQPKNWKVMIAGPDENNHRIEIENEIRRMGLEEVFSFVGPVEDQKKWALYEEADLFVLPSFSENFGIVVAEALGSGTPVISTQATPWPELKTRKCGWWIDVGIEPLVLALKEATSASQEQRLSMGQKGRQLILEKYTWEKIAMEMRTVYEWVLDKKYVPDCVTQPNDCKRH